MLSLAKPQKYYQVFLSQGLGMGIAVGIMYITISSVVAHHFRKRRSLAMVSDAHGIQFYISKY